MAKVINKLEIRVPSDNNESKERVNKITYFLIQPQNFFLQTESQMRYLSKIDYDNSRQEILKYSKLVIFETELNYNLFRKHSLLYELSTEFLINQKWYSWFISLMINIICLCTYRLNELLEGEFDKGDRKLEG